MIDDLALALPSGEPLPTRRCDQLATPDGWLHHPTLRADRGGHGAGSIAMLDAFDHLMRTSVPVPAA